MVKEQKEMLVPVEKQPYLVPANWQWVYLQTVCDSFQYGYTEKATYEKVGPHFIRITDIGDGVINEDNAPYCVISEENYGKYKINKNDILIARMGSVGENGIATHDIDGVFASYLIRLLPKFIPRYVSQFLQSSLYWQQITDSSQGTTRLNVNANILRQLCFPLPPLPEQKRIVDRIESLFAKLDEAKEKAQAVVDGFEDRKAAILHKAFTGELTAEWRKQHEIDISSWKKSQFGSLISEVKLGLVRGKAEQADTKCFGYLKMNNITSDGFVDLTGLVRVDATPEEVKEFSLRKGDFLFNTRNSFELVGKNAVWCYSEIPNMLYNNNIMRVRFDSRILSHFISYYFNSKVGKRELQKVKKNTTNIAAIYAKDLNRIEIPVPQIEEQQQMCQILDDVLDKAREVKEAAELIISRIDTMKKAILARAFRGELGTNDPSEPPADIGIS